MTATKEREPEVSDEFATLSLTIDVSQVYLGGWRTEKVKHFSFPGLSSPADVGELLGVIGALRVLSEWALAEDRSVYELAFAVGHLAAPAGQSEKQRDLWWAAQRAWGGDRRVPPTDPETLPAWSAEVADARVFVNELDYGSPFHVLASLGTAVLLPINLLVKSVENWLGSPDRIVTEHRKQKAKQAEYKADEAEAKLRELKALKEIEKLKRVAEPAIVKGVLTLP